ncbi:hypothetical protein TNCV_3574711 [Trichonephila clavipes]|nr:hypothetical protein TNCV_3574711 [Trichonephila clavipes]
MHTTFIKLTSPPKLRVGPGVGGLTGRNCVRPAIGPTHSSCGFTVRCGMLAESIQNDIPIDVACHRYTLNMQVGSEPRIIPPQTSHPAPP